jgi:hypothetical protein
MRERTLVEHRVGERKPDSLERYQCLIRSVGKVKISPVGTFCDSTNIGLD